MYIKPQYNICHVANAQILQVIIVYNIVIIITIIIVIIFFETEFHSCYPGWSAMA